MATNLFPQELVEALTKHAIQTTKERCLKAVDDEPTDTLYPEHHRVVSQTKYNIRKRIEEGVQSE